MICFVPTVPGLCLHFFLALLKHQRVGTIFQFLLNWLQDILIKRLHILQNPAPYSGSLYLKLGLLPFPCNVIHSYRQSTQDNEQESSLTRIKWYFCRKVLLFSLLYWKDKNKASFRIRCLKINSYLCFRLLSLNFTLKMQLK